MSVPLQLPLDQWHSFSQRIYWAYLETLPEANHPRQTRTFHFSAWLPVRGHCSVKIQGKTWEVPTGQWILIPPGLSTERFFSPDHRLLSIHFDFLSAPGLPLFRLESPVTFADRSYSEVKSAGVNLARFFSSLEGKAAERRWQTNDLIISLERFRGLQDLGLRFLTALLKPLNDLGHGDQTASSPDPRLRRAMSYVRSAPLDEPLDAAKLVRSSGLGLSRIRQLFRDRYQTSPHVLFARRRLDFACSALTSTDESVKSIAVDLGMTPAEFSRWFNREAGLSPRAYRNEPLRHWV